jgi:Asp-tRNA(Asn)/Glu-tRNA(Gln) amidotransferase A subunit family amidase
MTDEPVVGITELARAYRSGVSTPRIAVRTALDRLAAWEPRLNAFSHVASDTAYEDADRLGEDLRAGRDRGPLHGVPVVIKDLIEVAGMPTEFGSKVLSAQLASRDAELVRRLKAAGAIIIGKTNLLEYAYGVAHPEIGQTNNPHDPRRTSGGSSGGSAAAVAAGIVPLAIGTDTGGSIRIPAAYCGIVGFKPSTGLVPLDGVFPLSWSLDHGGPLCRTVEDTALAMSVLADRPFPLNSITAKGLRIGLIRRHWESREITPGVRQSIDAVAERLRDAGAKVTSFDISELEGVNAALRAILRPEASLIHDELLAINPAGYAPQTLAQLYNGRTVLATAYVQALRFRAVMRGRIEALFNSVDVFMSPSVPFVAPFTDPVTEAGEDGEMLSSGLANLTGQPAVSLPCGFSEGLPVGVQLMGRLNSDEQLLAVANALERLLLLPG